MSLLVKISLHGYSLVLITHIVSVEKTVEIRFTCNFFLSTILKGLCSFPSRVGYLHSHGIFCQFGDVDDFPLPRGNRCCFALNRKPSVNTTLHTNHMMKANEQHVFCPVTKKRCWHVTFSANHTYKFVHVIRIM